MRVQVRYQYSNAPVCAWAGARYTTAAGLPSSLLAGSRKIRRSGDAVNVPPHDT